MKPPRPRGATLMQSIQKAKENSAPSRQDERSEFEAAKAEWVGLWSEMVGKPQLGELDAFEAGWQACMASRREAGPGGDRANFGKMLAEELGFLPDLANRQLMTIWDKAVALLVENSRLRVTRRDEND